MDSIFISFSVVSHALFLLAGFGIFLPSVKTSSDYTTLVYKKCANQTYSGSIEPHSQTLFSSLFQEILAQASHTKFFKSTAGDTNLGISALFQCRGDLDNRECYNCVNKFPELSRTLCKQAVHGRLQLNGCYFHYETDGFTDETPKHELLHETCSKNKPGVGGFEEARDAAFAAMESKVVTDNGYSEMDYQFVHVMGQCEGDLGPCDCGECISIAVEIAQEDCGSSDSGQVYLDECHVSYAYNPNKTAVNSSKARTGSSGDQTGKKIAIVLGGAAALFGGFIFLRFIKSWGKKDDI